MKAVKIIIFVFFFLGFLQLQWLNYSPKELGACDSLKYFISDLEAYHAASLFDRQDFLSDPNFRLRAKRNFLTLNDPYGILFSKEDIADFESDNNLNNFCRGFYDFKTTMDQRTAEIREELKTLQFAHLDPKKIKLDNKSALEKSLLGLSYSNLEYEDGWPNALLTTKRAIDRDLQKNKVKLEQDIDGLIFKAVVNAVDPHSDYFMASNFMHKARWLKSSFLGLGVLVKEVYQGYKILKLVENGPAERQRLLKPNDIIVVADGKMLREVDQQDLSLILGGPEFSRVDLILRRSGKTLRVQAERGKVKSGQSLVQSEIKQIDGRKLGRIYLSQFFMAQNGIAGVSEEVYKALKAFNKNKVQGLVIDLRGNHGGVLDEVVKIVGFFIKSGPVVIEHATSHKGFKFYADTDGVSYFDKPVVILTDQRSASASEILAGSMKSLNRGVVIGNQQTFGKGTVQTVSSASNFFNNNVYPGALKLTTGYYYLPSGQAVQSVGVPVDVQLQVEKDEKSPQLEKNYANHLKQPENLMVDFDDYQKWISDNEFSDLVKYLKANQKVRGLLGKKKLNQENQAYKVLGDMIDFYKSQKLKVVGG